MGENDADLWSRLAGQARAGELYLDDEKAAYDCAKACDQRLLDLQQIARSTFDAQNVSGFGDFAMADRLVGKFLRQATGDPNSIDQIILEHIETVKNMREVMAISFKRITGQDIENATQIASTTDQVG
ncbi:hypothetical protein [Nocardia abscessus]|uniref:hypothetical protein n=1 Tax=Nocardia abscessus TaxID=120957 RepID=UPI0012FB3A73|nr:hypothetical protein [Nocardia abscessus]MBF6337043.1 hypothetical protein [Nocardia abscessus]MCC3329305.1 hypothetical protein [Nocardia abscessus]